MTYIDQHREKSKKSKQTIRTVAGQLKESTDYQLRFLATGFEP